MPCRARSRLSAVEVTITITDLPPQLAIPDRLDFHDPHGQRRPAARNQQQGGLVATGEVLVDAPWRIEPDAIGSAPGKCRLQGDLAPATGGTFEGSRASPPISSTAPLSWVRGDGSHDPAQVSCDRHPRSVRTANLIWSINDEPRTLELKTDGLATPAAVHRPAHGKITVPNPDRTGDRQALTAEIRVEAPNSRSSAGECARAHASCGPSAHHHFGRLFVVRREHEFRAGKYRRHPASVVADRHAFPRRAKPVLLVRRERSFSLDLDPKMPQVRA